MKTSRALLPVLVSLVVIAGLGALAGRAVIRADEDVKIAREATAKALKDAAVAADAAHGLQAQVVALSSQRDAAISRAASARHTADRLTAKLSALASVAPDTCSPVIITADSALAAKDSVIAADSVALQHSVAASQKLQLAVDTLTSALAELRVPATTLVKAETKASRWRTVSALLPHPIGGIYLGVDADGKPHTIVGIGLGWKLK